MGESVVTVLGIIQARAASTRLPGKIFAPLSGRTLLEVLLTRVRRARVDQWWLATTKSSQDDVTAAWGEALGARVYRGDEEDVLSRFAAIVSSERPEWVVRLTADDPFTDATIVDLLLREALALDARDTVLGDDPQGRELPLGYVPQVVRGATVLELDRELEQGSTHRAHVLSALYERGLNRRFSAPTTWPRRPDLRWTIDTPRDLEMARALFDAFGDRWSHIDYPEMIAELDGRPAVATINRDERQKVATEG